MSKVKGYTSGRPSLPHAPTVSVLKYFGKPRSPFKPSAFRRENMMDDDLKKEWMNSRGRTGPGHVNSGYSSLKEIKWDEHPTPMTPVSELAKFMPDIRVDGIQSTPVSMMHVRGGHRVTHDLLHSYDPAIARQVTHKSKEDGLASPMIDHDNISPFDDKFMGLHPQTMGSRARIYRYIRRAPLSDETYYYKRYVEPYRAPAPQIAMHGEIVDLCVRENNIEKACSIYRLLSHPPTSAVIKAMLDCCARLRMLGDAAALFEDFRRANRHACRTKDILGAYMDVAIACDHPQHAMVILGFVHGTTVDNFRYEGLTDVEKFIIGRHLLVWMLRKGYPEARSVYSWMQKCNFLQHDRHYRSGMEIGELLRQYYANDEKSDKDASTRLKNALTTQIAQSVAPHPLNQANNPQTQQNVLKVTQLHMDYRFFSKGAFSPDWLHREFNRVNIPYVSQLAEYIVKVPGDTDDQGEAAKRNHSRATHDAMLLLQPDQQRSVHNTVLPYFRKSHPSRENPCIRVIRADRKGDWMRTDTNRQAEFFFAKDGSTRFVTETFEVLDNLNVKQIYYGRNAIQHVASAEQWN